MAAALIPADLWSSHPTVPTVAIGVYVSAVSWAAGYGPEVPPWAWHMITPERGHYLAAAIASLCDAGLLRATAAGHVVMGAQLPPPGPGGPPPGRPVPVLEVHPDAEHLGVAA